MLLVYENKEGKNVLQPLKIQAYVSAGSVTIS